MIKSFLLIVAVIFVSVISIPGCLAVDSESVSSSQNIKTKKIVDEINSRVNATLLRISLPAEAGKKVNRGISSMLLYSGEFLIEAPSFTRFGPVSTAERIPAEKLKNVIGLLASHGLFESAQKFHSESVAIDPKFPPPKDSKPISSRKSVGEVSVTNSDDHWYTYYEINIPNGQAGKIFELCSKELTGDAAKYMSELAQKCSYEKSYCEINSPTVNRVSMASMAIGFPLALAGSIAGILMITRKKGRRRAGGLILAASLAVFIISIATPGLTRWILENVEKEGILPMPSADQTVTRT